MTRRDFALLFLILLLGAGITVAHKVRLGCLPPGVHVEGLEFLQGPLHTFSETGEADLPPGGRVTIEAGHGDVQVLTWSERKVRAEVKKQLHGEKEEDAARQASGLKLEMLPGAGSLLVRAAGSRPPGLSAEFTVTIPEQSRLQVITDHGSVVVHGVKGDALIKTAHSDVEVEDLGGSLEVVNDDGSINLRRIQGPVVLRTSHGDIEASDLSGSATVECEDGDVTLARVAGGVKVTHAHGDVRISEAGADVHLMSHNADVTLSDIRGRVEIADEHGSVRVERAGSDLKVTAPHCEVRVEDLSGSLTATVQGDSLTATSVKGAVRVEVSASSVRLTDVRGGIQVAGTHTPVEIVRPGSEVEVDTTNQEIRIASPAGKGFRVDARADQGEVTSDIEGLHVPGDRPSHFAGTVGNGSTHYHLTTSHATISILTADSEPTQRER